MTMKRAILVLLVLASACGGSSSPTTPTPTPTPTPTSFALTGGISETIPTTSNKIPGATVTFIDGSNAGKSAVADGAGNYRITNVLAGGFSVRASAAGYEDSTRSVTITGDAALTFTLNPTPKMMTTTRNDNLSGGDTTCSDGTFTKPCRTVALPIHNPGTLSASLDWDVSSSDLDLTLWRGSTLIAESKLANGRHEAVSSSIPSGASYELRVTYYGGSVITPFRLTVTHPN